MSVKILKGQNIEFSVNTIPKEETKTIKNTSILGTFINFDMSEAKKDGIENISLLEGTYLDFSIVQIGRWVWEEKKKAVCSICKLPIKEQIAASCPMCQSIFHESHIFEWLKIKGKCPVCFQALNPGGTTEVKL